MPVVNIEHVFRARLLLFEKLLKNAKTAAFFGPSPPPLNLVEAIKEAESTGFRRLDYIQGRVMKCDLSTYNVETWGYDRDNGAGTFQRCVDETAAYTKHMKEKYRHDCY